MSEAAHGKRELTVHETHFPPVVIAAAAACWGLCLVGAALEAFLR